MTIGEVIKKYRKELGLTQQEMAERLGVTTPAVNKWERGNSQPDISLLAPIARLLGITTDILLSFRDNLTEEEISLFIRELDRALETSPYEEAFARAKKKTEEYPNCSKLILNTALLLESHRLIDDIPDKEDYSGQICDWYLRVLESEDETIRKKAAESLYWFYTRQERHEEAEKYLAYFPADDPDKNRYQALIYYSTGKKEEAYRSFENLLLTEFNRLQMILNDLCILYIKDNDHVMAHKFVNIECALAGLFEMGAYQQAAPGLELATLEKNTEETERIMRTLLENCDTLTNFVHSDLYRHISPRTVESSFFRQLKSNLIRGFLDEETYGYMEGNPYWEELKTSDL